MVEKLVNIFKEYKMLVISSVPEAERVSEQVYSIISQMKPEHASPT